MLQTSQPAAGATSPAAPCHGHSATSHVTRLHLATSPCHEPGHLDTHKNYQKIAIEAGLEPSTRASKCTKHTAEPHHQLRELKLFHYANVFQTQ